MHNLEPAIIEFIEAAKHLKDAMDATYLYFRDSGLSEMRSMLLLRTQFLEIVRLKADISPSTKNAVNVIWGFWSPPYFAKKSKPKNFNSALLTHGLREGD